MEVQNTVFYIIGVTLIITVLLLIVNKKVKAADPLAKPQGVVLLAIVAYRFIDNMVKEKTNEEMAKKLSPYYATVAVYVLISNISGLINFESPTANYSVTLTLAAITCLIIEFVSCKSKGVGGYIKSIPGDFTSKVSRLLSLSLRLFGNVLSGSVVMTLMYSMLGYISSLIPVIGNVNFVGMLICPVLHAYFDLFSGAMQTYIFIVLSTSFIGNALPTEN